MPRPSNTAQRRQEIVEGLMTVMSECGYDGATIPLIAQAANLTAGLVHYHFRDKQSILIELIEYLVGLIDQRFQALSKRLSSRKELEAFIDAHLAFGEGANAGAVACWVVIGAEAVKQPEIRAAYRRATERQLLLLEEICRRALVKEGRSTKRARDIALAVIAAIEGAYRLLVSVPEFVPAGFAAPTIRQMAAGLMQSQPKTRGR